MENFCYWHENVPDYIQLNKLMGVKKICLLRQMEYKIEKESGIESKINIFCPFQSVDQATEMDCKIGIKINEDVSKQTN